MIWLLLLFAVHPTSLDLSGAAGAPVSADLMIVGDERVRISGGGALMGDSLVELDGKKHVRIPMRVRHDATQGLQHGFVYVTRDSDDPVLEASTVSVRVNVSRSSAPTGLVAGTSSAFGRAPWMPVAAVLALLGAIGLAVRVQR